MSDSPRPMARISRAEERGLVPERIRQVRTPAVYWDGEGFAPAWITGWYRDYGVWWVRLRTRRDVWRDQEYWYVYGPGRLLPVRLDPRDIRDWLPQRPLD